MMINVYQACALERRLVPIFQQLRLVSYVTNGSIYQTILVMTGGQTMARNNCVSVVQHARSVTTAIVPSKRPMAWIATTAIRRLSATLVTTGNVMVLNVRSIVLKKAV